MKKIVSLIAGSHQTQRVLCNQLRKLTNSKVQIFGFSITNDTKSIFHLPEDSLLVFSSKSVFKEYEELTGKNISQTKYVIGKRTINHNHIDTLLLLPPEKVLFVNDDLESTSESIQKMDDLGIDISQFQPYYPGCQDNIKGIKIAVTPGESDVVPKSIERTYDIGVRVFDFATLMKIFRKLGVQEKGMQKSADQYSEDLVKMAKRIADAIKEADRLTSTLRQELIGRGHFAKYEFSDIIGSSIEMQEQKYIAKRISDTELSVLIRGENGTGKELFASAIHNSSSRRKYPFVAVNFSALSDDLIESELFGYEEGAFTGARKGGKTGLFEQANGGTIFLDEIGDISLKTQTRLLRVLQEKEIMRVGGDCIIAVDVRIIAATNKNLEEMIEAREFREDLYYRLKMGEIQIPPLRQRTCDIGPIIDKTLETRFDYKVEMESKVRDILIMQDWKGNVRELINTIMYMEAIAIDHKITVKDIPINFRKILDIENMQWHNPLEKRVYEKIYELNSLGVVAGREKILEKLNANGENISIYQVRKSIENLKSKGMIINRPNSYGLYCEKVPNSPKK